MAAEGLEVAPLNLLPRNYMQQKFDMENYIGRV